MLTIESAALKRRTHRTRLVRGFGFLDQRIERIAEAEFAERKRRFGRQDRARVHLARGVAVFLFDRLDVLLDDVVGLFVFATQHFEHGLERGPADRNQAAGRHVVHAHRRVVHVEPVQALDERRGTESGRPR